MNIWQSATTRQQFPPLRNVITYHTVYKAEKERKLKSVCTMCYMLPHSATQYPFIFDPTIPTSISNICTGITLRYTYVHINHIFIMCTYTCTAYFYCV